MRIKRIAVEEAFVTEEIEKEWKKVRKSKFCEPGFLKVAEALLGDSSHDKDIASKLLDLGQGRIEQMDAAGIDLAVLSITSPGVQVFDAITAKLLAEQANDALAEAV